MWATLLLPVADPAFPLALAVPPSPSLSPSLQVSGANYAGTFEVTRARGTYPTSLSATLPPARYGTVRCSTAQVGRAQPSPAQPSFLVPVSLSLFLACVKVSQSASQSISRSAPRAVIHSFAQSHPPRQPVKQANQSNWSSAWEKGAYAHCTLGLPHCARPSLPPCLHLPPKPAHTLLACCTLHLAPCYHPTSFLCVLVVCMCVCVINVRVRVCLREHGRRGVELISKFHIHIHPSIPTHILWQHSTLHLPQPCVLPSNCPWEHTQLPRLPLRSNSRRSSLDCSRGCCITRIRPDQIS